MIDWIYYVIGSTHCWENQAKTKKVRFSILSQIENWRYSWVRSVYLWRVWRWALGTSVLMVVICRGPASIAITVQGFRNWVDKNTELLGMSAQGILLEEKCPKLEIPILATNHYFSLYLAMKWKPNLTLTDILTDWMMSEPQVWTQSVRAPLCLSWTWTDNNLSWWPQTVCRGSQQPIPLHQWNGKNEAVYRTYKPHTCSNTLREERRGERNEGVFVNILDKCVVKRSGKSNTGSNIDYHRKVKKC